MRNAILSACLLGVLLQPLPAQATGHAAFGEINRGRDGQDGRLSRDVTAPSIQPTPKARGVRLLDDGMVWVGLPRVGSMEGDDGEIRHCRAINWVRVPADERDERLAQAEDDYLWLYQALPELWEHDPYRECPVDPGDEIPPAILRDAVIRTIRDDMPRPILEVPPGYALTGMPAYLVTNHDLEYGPVTHTVDLGMAVFDVTVTATGTTEVDWGDGTVVTYHSPGAPWPDGEVVHTYRDAGTVTISVLDTWEVTYRVPALGIVDTVTAPLPARALDAFEIQQVQAVRVSD
jgi:hypothetical protein